MKQQDSGQPAFGSLGHPEPVSDSDKGKKEQKQSSSDSPAEGTDPSLTHGKVIRRSVPRTD